MNTVLWSIVVLIAVGAEPGEKLDAATPSEIEEQLIAPPRERVLGVKPEQVVLEERKAVAALQAIKVQVWAGPDGHVNKVVAGLAGNRLSDAEMPLIGSFPQLTDLFINGSDYDPGPTITISPAGLLPLVKLAKLRNLDINIPMLSEEHLTVLGQIASIERLSLITRAAHGSRFGTQVLHDPTGESVEPETDVGKAGPPPVPLTGRAMAHLSSLTRLERLTLGDFCTGDDVLREAAKHKTLRRVSLEAAVTPAGMAALRALPALEWLTIVRCPPIEVLAEAGRITTLERLILEQPGLDWTDERLEKIRGRTRLRALDLMACSKITDAGMVYVGRLTGLETLSLSSTAVGDAGVVRLAGLAKLQKLDLGHTRVTDAGMPAVAKLSALNVLCLSGTAVSDAGMDDLARLPKLSRIDLGGTHVSAVGEKILKARGVEVLGVYDFPWRRE